LRNLLGFFLVILITFFHHLKNLQRFSFGWVMDRINQVKIPLLYCSVRMEVRNATGLRMYVLQWSVEGVKQMRGEIHLVSVFSKQPYPFASILSFATSSQFFIMRKYGYGTHGRMYIPFESYGE